MSVLNCVMASVFLLFSIIKVQAADDGRYAPLPSTATSGDGATIPESVEFRPNISFNSGDGHTMLQMDVAVPKPGKGPFPAGAHLDLILDSSAGPRTIKREHNRIDSRFSR